MGDPLRSLPLVFRLSRETVRIIRQNIIFFAFGVNGVGIVLIHDSATMSIAIYYWWQYVNELHQRVYTGPLNDPRALTQLADPAAGCVYELSVLDFESRAWLQDVLSNPSGPDIDRYLSRQFNADV